MRWISSCLFILTGCLVLSFADEWETLKEKIFKRYDPGVRPRCGGVDTVTNVTLGVALRQILKLHSPSQEISINVWMRLNWKDCRLTWNETEHGIPHFQLPVNRVWRPDITVYDSTQDEALPGINEYRAKVYSDGRVSYNWPSIVAIFCKLYVKNFPMDKQVCKFIYTSWVYNGAEIDWIPMFKTGDLSNYEENAEWTVEEYVTERHSALYSCCPYPFVDLTFYLHIHRRALHYVINLIFPCVLISALTQLGFILPVESGEKVSLQITVMLSLAVFLLVISEHLPPSSDSIPLVGVYFALTLVLVTISCTITVVVLNIHFKSHRRVPGLIKRIFIQTLGKLLLVRQISRHKEKAHKPSHSSQRHMVDDVSNYNNNIQMDRIMDNMGQHIELPRRMSKQHDVMHSDIRSDFQKYVDSVSSRMEINRNNELHRNGSDIDHQMSEHGTYLRKIAGHFEEADAEDDLRLEWHVLACVIDRLFFVICMTFLIGSTVAIFMKLDE